MMQSQNMEGSTPNPPIGGGVGAVVAEAQNVNAHVDVRVKPSSPSPSSSSSSNNDNTTTNSSNASRRLACALNDVGALLSQRGDHQSALRHYQEAVQVRMDALRREKIDGGGGSDCNKAGAALTSLQEEEAAAESRVRALSVAADGLRRAEDGGRESSSSSTVDMFRLSEDGSDMEDDGIDESQDAASNEFHVRSDPVELVGCGAGAGAEGGGGDDSSESAVTLYNMGLVHLHHGSLEMATKLFGMALQVGTGSCPRTLTARIQFDTAVAKYRAGSVEEATANLGEALRLLRGAAEELRVRRAQLQMQHQHQHQHQHLHQQSQRHQQLADAERQIQLSVADVMSLMGRIQRASGNAAKALDLSREVLRIRRAVLGDSDLSVASTLYNIGLSLYDNGDVREAIEHCTYFVTAAATAMAAARANGNQHRRQQRASYHRHLAEALHALGMMHLEDKSVSKAIECLQGSIAYRRSQQQQQQQQQDHRRSQQGVAQQEPQGRQQQAGPPPDPAVVETLMSLGRIMQDTGRYNDAMASYREALSVVAALMGGSAAGQDQQDDDDNDNESYATILCSIGQVHQAKGDLSEAIQSYEEVLRIARSLFGQEDEFVASMLTSVGNVYLERGDTDVAMTKFAEAARILRGLGLDDGNSPGTMSGPSSTSSSGGDAFNGLAIVPSVGQGMGLGFYPHAAAA